MWTWCEGKVQREKNGRWSSSEFFVVETGGKVAVKTSTITRKATVLSCFDSFCISVRLNEITIWLPTAYLFACMNYHKRHADVCYTLLLGEFGLRKGTLTSDATLAQLFLKFLNFCTLQVTLGDNNRGTDTQICPRTKFGIEFQELHRRQKEHRPLSFNFARVLFWLEMQVTPCTSTRRRD